MSDEKLREIVMDYANAQEAAVVSLKRQIAELAGIKEEQKKESAAVSEQNFTILKFELQQGSKIGEYAVAYKTNNLPEKWNSAFNVLSKSNAVINDRYHGQNYEFSYWLYGEGKIYRQKLKPKT